MIAFQEEEPSIVIRGRFNPSIFQPSWFGRHKLVRESEADGANVVLITGEVSQFTMGWLDFLATADRLQAKTADIAHEDVLRDLVLGTFGLLEHVPVEVLGVNRNMHVRLDGTKEMWHRVGNTLAPKAVWNDLLADPGMRQLTMQGERSDGLTGQVYVRVEPSAKVPYGIFVSVNHHLTLAANAPLESAMDILRQHWSRLQRDARTVATGLIEAAAGGEA